jgi:hypothetical protein
VNREAYAGFRDDALLTLGRCMMDRECWSGQDIVIGRILHRSNDNPNRVWTWWDASGDLSASLFFCMKYLPESRVEPWLRSVLAITSPHWRAQLIVWMVGAHGMLNGAVRWPADLPENARPSVDWSWSHCLSVEEPRVFTGSAATPTAAFIPERSRLKALETFRSYFVEDVFRDWLITISTVPYLEAELAEIPDTFASLYVSKRQPEIISSV